MENQEPNPIETVAENNGKTIAIISYLTLVGWIIAYVMNGEKKEKFATFHIRQALGLMLTAFACSLINIIPILGWLLYLPLLVVLIIMWVNGLMNAVNNKEKPIMILGKKYEQWFKNL